MESLLIKLASEMPILMVYLFSAKWAIEKLESIWKVYMANVVTKETEILDKQQDIISRLTVIEDRFKRITLELAELSRSVNWSKTKIEDVQNYLALRSRKSDVTNRDE